jgi:hypothetical protein
MFTVIGSTSDETLGIIYRRKQLLDLMIAARDVLPTDHEPGHEESHIEAAVLRHLALQLKVDELVFPQGWPKLRKHGPNVEELRAVMQRVTMYALTMTVFDPKYLQAPR